MVKQTISKDEAENRITAGLKRLHPEASSVSLNRSDDEHWRTELDGHDVDKTLAADANTLLHELLQECDISEMPTGAVTVEHLDTGNDN